MSGDTLILNSDGNPLSIIPLSIISWQEAIKLVYLQKVTVLENYDNWTVHSSRLAIQVPAVVMTKKFYEKANRIRFTRQNLYFRDEGCCQYCSQSLLPKEITLDHVLPKSLGGKRTWDNSVISCERCNSTRGSDTRIKPKKKPHKPTYYELVNNRKKFPITLSHPSWNDYLGWDPTLVVKGYAEEESFKLDDIIPNKNNLKK